MEMFPPNNKTFTDAVPDHNKFWALIEGSFVGYRPNKAGDMEISIVEL